MKDNIKIRVEKVPEKKLKALMRGINELNNGNEIGAWLIGEWKKEDNNIIAQVEDIHIPKQTVSRAEVDISPENMISTIKELGVEKSRKIIGHWHIHPFGKGKTDWSGIDERKIDDFMEPEKGRQIFLFMLSSEDWIKGRIEMNLTSELKGLPINIKQNVDDIEPEYEKEAIDDEILEEIKKEIKDKVEEEKKVWNTWKDTTGYKKKEKDELFKVIKRPKKKEVEAILKKEFSVFIDHYAYTTDELKNPDERKVHKKTDTLTWKLKQEESVEKVAEMIEEELSALKTVYEDEQMLEGKIGSKEYNKSYWEKQEEEYRKRLGITDPFNWYNY